MKPILIDPRFLRPLPKPMLNTACAKCDKRQAVWELGGLHEDRHAICSLCFMYESNWGRNRTAQLLELVTAVEAEAGEEFSKDDEGRLTNPQDANRIMASIALTSRMFKMQEKVGEPPLPKGLGIRRLNLDKRKKD